MIPFTLSPNTPYCGSITLAPRDTRHAYAVLRELITPGLRYRRVHPVRGNTAPRPVHTYWPYRRPAAVNTAVPLVNTNNACRCCVRLALHTRRLRLAPFRPRITIARFWLDVAVHSGFTGFCAALRSRIGSCRVTQFSLVGAYNWFWF